MASDNLGVVSETNAELQEFIDNEEFIHYIGMVSRPGVAKCTSILEHTYYEPDTDRNELFIMRLIKWNEFLWVIVSIPTEEKDNMDEVAQKCGLRIVSGSPTMLGGGSADIFPANGKNVYTLENQSDHPVYRNDPLVNEALRQDELETIEIMEKHTRNKKK